MTESNDVNNVFRELTVETEETGEEFERICVCVRSVVYCEPYTFRDKVQGKNNDNNTVKCLLI